jgi:hypothetical protein
MPNKCVICKKPVVVKAPGVQCGIVECGLYYHFVCAKLADEEIDKIEKGDIVFACEPCRKKKITRVFKRGVSVSESESEMKNMSLDEIIETQNELKENVKKLTSMVEDLNLKIDHFNSVIVRFEDIALKLEKVEKEEKTEKSEQKISYSSIVRKNLPVVVVKPKNSDQNSLETSHQIKSLFDPVESKINGLKNVSKGGVVIVCKDKASTKKCSEELISKLGEDYEVSLPESKGPLLKVWGMTEVIPKEDFIDKIRRQNDCIRKSSKINVVNIKANRRGVASLIEVDEQTYESLLSVGRIYIGWDSCRVYQHMDILRCFKCNQFGHMAIKCERAVCCADCAENHESKDCDSGVKKCVNCEYAKKTFKIDVNSNHPAYSMKCPAYLKKLEHKLKYGQ